MKSFLTVLGVSSISAILAGLASKLRESNFTHEEDFDSVIESIDDAHSLLESL